tara:strand:+ start:3518 stop:3946 length:429 start_codon:yes stop_codon:yes gene_type:complete
MNKLKHKLLRISTLGLAFFVALLSTGFTYNWEVCLDVDETIVCKSESDKGVCVCVEIPVCSCSDKSHNTCDLSFSQLVQFDFEVLLNKFRVQIPQLVLLNSPIFANASESIVYAKLYSFSNYSIPPPKSGRTLLCTIQTFLI